MFYDSNLETSLRHTRVLQRRRGRGLVFGLRGYRLWTREIAKDAESLPADPRGSARTFQRDMEPLRALLLSGWTSHRGDSESCDYHQASLRTVLEAAGWAVRRARVRDAADVQAALQPLDDGRPLLIVYTGHGCPGDGAGAPPGRPLVCPGAQPLDLLALAREGPTSYLLDTLDLEVRGAPGGDEPGPALPPDIDARCLDPAQRFVVALRPGTPGLAQRQGTMLNLGLCAALLHVPCADIAELCRVLNCFCRAEYRARGLADAAKFVLTLNGKNPALRAPAQPEALICQTLRAARFPDAPCADPSDWQVVDATGLRSLETMLGAAGPK